MAGVPAPLKYGEIARIQRHFLTQNHVQVGPLVVCSFRGMFAWVFGQLDGPGKAAGIDRRPRTAELRGILEIACLFDCLEWQGQQSSEYGAALSPDWTPLQAH